MIIKKSVAAAAIAGATLLGGAVGMTMLGTASAATTTTPSTRRACSRGDTPVWAWGRFAHWARHRSDPWALRCP